jgi:hypothetical protein
VFISFIHHLEAALCSIGKPQKFEIIGKFIFVQALYRGVLLPACGERPRLGEGKP